MPVWTDVKDDMITSLGGANFADEARFGARDVPDVLECKGHISDTNFYSCDMPIDGIGYWTLSTKSLVFCRRSFPGIDI